MTKDDAGDGMSASERKPAALRVTSTSVDPGVFTVEEFLTEEEEAEILSRLELTAAWEC